MSPLFAKAANGVLLGAAGVLIGLAPVVTLLLQAMTPTTLSIMALSLFSLYMALVTTKNFLLLIGSPVLVGSGIGFAAFPQFGAFAWGIAAITGVIGFRIARYGATELLWARHEARSK